MFWDTGFQATKLHFHLKLNISFEKMGGRGRWVGW